MAGDPIPSRRPRLGPGPKPLVHGVDDRDDPEYDHAASVRPRKPRTADGREVQLVRLAVAGTYDGMLEGTPGTASPSLLRRTPARAASMLPPAKPLVVVPPAGPTLPPWTYVAEVVSSQGIRNVDPDFSSRLYVCWFAEGTERSVDRELSAALARVNWKASAEDFDLMM